MCVIMASCQNNEWIDDSEVREESCDAVSDERAGSSKDFETDKANEKEEETLDMQDKIRMLENEVLCLKSDMGKIDEKIEAKIEAKMGGEEWWNEEEQPPAVIRLSNWTKTQIRCLETHIGRVRRETFDHRLKIKREIEYETRDYLFNLDAQINKIRSRMTLVEVEIWPGGGPMLREQKAALGGYGVLT